MLYPSTCVRFIAGSAREFPCAIYALARHLQETFYAAVALVGALYHPHLPGETFAINAVTAREC